MNNDDPNSDRREMRMMWIGTAAIVLLLLGGMGINMLMHRDTGAAPNEISSQSRTVTPK